MLGKYATRRRPAPAPMSPPLAHAFLALADDDAALDQRTLPRVLAAAAAAVVLALGAPLGLPRRRTRPTIRSAALELQVLARARDDG